MNPVNVEVSRLANGLTIATQTMPHVESTALGVWIKSGSRNETEEQHGIAHLLEHMAFKGTSSRSAYEIASQIENVGGEINAATSVETTAFYARVLTENVPLAIDLLADILTDSKFDPEELEREKHVILQEIGAAHDTPDDVVFDRFTETVFRHQMIGRSILGTPETVTQFSSQDLHDYLASHYGADKMVLVAVGNIEHEDIVREAEAKFGGFRKKATAGAMQFANYVGGDYRENRDLLDAHLILGFEGRAYHVRDFYASQILSAILGGGMSSRLFQEVREKRGLCYSVYAFHWGFSDTGIFGVHAATGEADIGELVPVIVSELRKAGERIGQEELDRAKAQYRAGLLMSGENSGSRASQIARQILLYGRPVPSEELMDRLSAISVDRLSDLSQRLFMGTKPTVTGLGPIRHLPEFAEISGMMASSSATEQRAAVI